MFYKCFCAAQGHNKGYIQMKSITHTHICTHTINALNPTQHTHAQCPQGNTTATFTPLRGIVTTQSYFILHTLYAKPRIQLKCISSRWKSSRVLWFPLSYSLSPALFLCLGTWIPSCADYTQSSLKAYFSCLQNFCRLIWLCIMLKWEKNPSWDFFKDFSKALSPSG